MYPYCGGRHPYTAQQASWAVTTEEEEDKERFYCSRHLLSGIRQARLHREDVIKVRELFV